MTFDASALHKLAGEFGRAGAAIGSDVAVEVDRAAEQVADTMRRLVPVLRGELRGSITVAGAGLHRTVTATAKHGQFLEHGTAFMAPQPFAEPATEGQDETLSRAVRRAATERLS